MITHPVMVRGLLLYRIKMRKNEKHQEKKLALRTETVRRLQPVGVHELAQVVGGSMWMSARRSAYCP